MSKEFIDGVHDYCDRWCERCEFAARCRVGFAEIMRTQGDGNIQGEAFLQHLTISLEETRMMLEQIVNEEEIEFDDPVSPEEYAEIQRRTREYVEGDELSKLSDRYWRAAKKALDESVNWSASADLDDDTRANMLEVIGWYLMFIPAKIRRGVQGLVDDSGDYFEEELNDPQSDANGSIKIALIAAEKSRLAWTILMSDENAPDIAQHVAVLKELEDKTEARFPLARDFVRPGFDEFEMVM